MDEIKDGGPAFPLADGATVHLAAVAAIQGVTDSAERDRLYSLAAGRAASGMTLRDYLAAKAMQAVSMKQSELHDIQAMYDRLAIHAYKVADAMLRARDNA